MFPRRSMLASLSLAAIALTAAPLAARTVTNVQYVNGLTVPGNTQDLAGPSSTFNRLGMFRTSITTETATNGGALAIADLVGACSRTTRVLNGSHLP